MKKPILAVDIDNVLAGFSKAANTLLKEAK